MKFWTPAEAANHVDVPAHVADLSDVTLDVLRRLGDDRVRFIRIGCNDGGQQDERHQVDLEIAPGVVMPTMLGSIEGVECGWDDPSEDEDNLAILLEEGLACCLPVLEDISDAIHDARLRARKVIAGWNAQGITTRLIDVRLDHWLDDGQPAVQVTVEDLDDALEPVGTDITIENCASLEIELDATRVEIGAAYVRRAALASKGASGTIDQTTLNALGHFGGIAEGIRGVAGEQRFWFEDDTAIVTMNGHVYTGSGDPDAPVQLNGDHITVRSTFIAPELLRAAIGRPATELVDHHFLSGETTVLEASCAITNGMPMLTIRIDNPKRLFCSGSGRVWEDVAGDLDHTVAEYDRSGSVVPFRRRTA